MQAKGRFYYTFAVAAAYCLVIPAIYLFSNPLSTYMVPTAEDLHISRGIYSPYQTIHEIIPAIVYFLYVKAQKRFGLRELATMGLPCATLSVVRYAATYSVPPLFPGGAFSALIWPLSSQVTTGSIINSWLARKSATVISVTFGCGNITGFLNAKIIAYWISHYGWKRSMFYIMAIALVVAVIAYAVTHSHLSEKGLHARGTPQGGEQPDEVEEDGLSKLPGADSNTSTKNIKLYSAYVWCSIADIIIYPMVGAFSAQLMDIGLDAAVISDAMGIMNVGSLVLLIPLGQVIDRWGIRSATVACVLSHLGIIVLLFTVSLATPVLTTIAEFLIGAVVLLFTILPLFMKEVFGFREFVKFMSCSVIFRTVGDAIGLPMSNLVYDYAGSYRIALLVFAGISLLLLPFGCIITSKKNPL